MPKISFKGIVCVGRNHEQAVDNFRNTAKGQGMMFFASQSGDTYASQSGADLYSPAGNKELLAERPDLVEKANFASESSSDDIRANYTICLDGCGSHIVSESSAHVTHCPSCSADLGEISDERIHEHLATIMDAQSVSHDGLVAVGASAEEAQTNFLTALSSATSFVAESGTGSFKAAHAVKFDPYSGAEVSSTSQASDEVVAALSSAIVGDNQNVDVHMYSCSASCENPFTVSSDENPVFCAHCSAPLIDVEEEESVSSDDEGSDIDILDDEDEDDLDVDDEDEDEEESESNVQDEDDEDLPSLSADDLEEDEEEDDEDLDEDEEEEEDDLDDLEDLEDLEDEDEEEDDDDFGDEDEDELDEELEEDDEDFDSESAAGDDEEDDLLIDDEDLDELEDSDDEIDDSEFESDSANKPVSRTFDSLSVALAAHTNLNPQLVSLSRAQHGSVPTVYLNYDGMPVAAATFQSVSNAVGEEIARNQFESDNFLRAVKADLNANGVVETCSNFGFEPFKIEMPVDKLLANEADARINAVTADVQQTISASVDAHQERFIAALSTAMLGVSKGFWQGSSNPVVESLCSAFTAAGVKEPRKIIERAFFNHSPDFLTVALSQASKLMATSEIAQNEIAEAVSSSVGISRSNDDGESRQQPVQQQEQPKVSAAQRLAIQSDADPVQSQSSASVDSFAAKAANVLRM